MKVLFWIPPWAVNNDALYFRNVFLKHLSIQANLLTQYASVDFAFPIYYSGEKSCLNSRVTTIELPIESDYLFSYRCDDIYQELYKNGNSQLVEEIVLYLSNYFSEDYDVIITWENAVPYFKKLFPDAIIISQMPGIFSRAPYPHTVIFDPVGLYNDGILSLYSEEILTGKYVQLDDLNFATEFKKTALDSLRKTEVIELSQNVSELPMKGEEIKLLPLQTSYHYAFKADTSYNNQMDFIHDVLGGENNISSDILATQYVSRLYQDTPLNKYTYTAMRSKYPQLYFSEAFNKISSVSQYLLLYCDTVVSASSSIGLQGFCLGKNLEVKGNTFQKKYATIESQYIPNADQNTLAFMLSRHQVLASKILHDGKFLFNLISKMLANKHEGKTGIDLLINYTELDKKYFADILLSFRLQETQAFNLKNVSDSQIEEQKFINKYIELIYDDNIHVISFDIFDTLIKRGVEKPVDVYKLMDNSVRILTGGMISKFSRDRAIAETEARRIYSDKDEITLDDIYHTMSMLLDVELDILIPIKNMEIQKEISVSSARKFGLKLINLAQRTGKRIILISDMYHSSHVIKQILDKAGICDYDKLYVSSEYNATKKTGELYRIVLNDLNISAQHILHIGDNKQTDIIAAQSIGLNALRWSSAIEWMRTCSAWKEIYHPRTKIGAKERSVLAGLTALGLYDSPKGDSCYTSLTGGDIYRFGYAILGPMLLGYMLWLKNEACKKGITDLYFLSREGFILKEIFDILLADNKQNIKTHYLYCSRRAIRVSSLIDQNDIFALVAEPYTEGVSIKSLLYNRFGLLVDGIEFDKKLSRSTGDQLLWRQTCRKLEKEILLNAQKERDGYLLYLNNMDIMTAQRPAIVDVGWSGNMQGYLCKLLDRDIYGFYYATLSGIDFWQSQGIHSSAYLGENLPNFYDSSVIKNRHLFEYILCHSDPSFVYMALDKGKISPKFRQEENLSIRKAFISNLHHGAKEYSVEFIKHFKYESEFLVIDPQSAELAFSFFVNKPSKLDAELFQGQAFEDAVGGIEKKYIVAPNHRDMIVNSVWSKGAQLLYDQFSLKVKKTKGHTKKTESSENINLSTVPETKDEYAIEAWILKRVLSERKMNKYLKDRKRYFLDSKSRLIHYYYNMTKR